MWWRPHMVTSVDWWDQKYGESSYIIPKWLYDTIYARWSVHVLCKANYRFVNRTSCFSHTPVIPVWTQPISAWQSFFASIEAISISKAWLSICVRYTSGTWHVSSSQVNSEYQEPHCFVERPDTVAKHNPVSLQAVVGKASNISQYQPV